MDMIFMTYFDLLEIIVKGIKYSGKELGYSEDEIETLILEHLIQQGFDFSR